MDEAVPMTDAQSLQSALTQLFEALITEGERADDTAIEALGPVLQRTIWEGPEMFALQVLFPWNQRNWGQHAIDPSRHRCDGVYASRISRPTRPFLWSTTSNASCDLKGSLRVPTRRTGGGRYIVAAGLASPNAVLGILAGSLRASRTSLRRLSRCVPQRSSNSRVDSRRY